MARAPANPLGIQPAPRADDPTAMERWFGWQNQCTAVLQQGTITAVHDDLYVELEPMRNLGEGVRLYAAIPWTQRGQNLYSVGCIVNFASMLGGTDASATGRDVRHMILDDGCLGGGGDDHGCGCGDHGICVEHGDQSDVTCNENEILYELEMTANGPEWTFVSGECAEGYCPNKPVYIEGQCIGMRGCSGCEPCPDGHGDDHDGGHDSHDGGHGDHGDSHSGSHGGHGGSHGGDGHGGHGGHGGDGHGGAHGGCGCGGCGCGCGCGCGDVICTSCCVNCLPTELHADADISAGCAGTGTSDCTAPGSALTWNSATSRWEGPTPFQGPGGDYDLHVWCNEATGLFEAELTDGVTTETVTQIDFQSCEPLVINLGVDDLNAPGIVCCNGGPQNIQIVITA